jgi:Mg-chelatase subunit ChlD
MSGDKQLRKPDTSKLSEITNASQGIEIVRTGKPIVGSPKTGYVYLLVDSSISMRGNKISQAKSGALNFAKNALGKGYVTGLIQFDSSPTLLCEPDTNLSVLDRALMRITIGDLTHMAKAITLANNLLKNISSTKVIVIITDGMPNEDGDPEITLKAASVAKNNGIDIIAIGTDDADHEFLKRIASRTDLAVKTTIVQLGKTIGDSVTMLPSGNKGINKA